MLRSTLCCLLVLSASCATTGGGAPIDSTLATAEVLYMKPGVALERLKAGNQRFVDATPRSRNRRARMEAVTTGSIPPFAAVWTTDDPRLPLTAAFDAAIGEIRMIRTPALASSDAAIGSLAMSAASGTKAIVILGHSDYDVATNACLGLPQPHLASEASMIVAAQAAASAEEPTAFTAQLSEADAAMVRYVRTLAAELPQRSETLQLRIDQGQLIVIPAYYDVATGAIMWL